MANADGSVIIKADIDDKQAQKELNALEKKIEALQEKLTNKKSARDTLFNQANNLGAQLDQAKAKLAQMKGGGEFFTSDAIKQQEAAVASMEKEWNAMNDKLDKQNAAIREGEAELDRMKAKAGELGKQLGNTGKNAGKIQEGLDKASQGMEAFTKRVKMLAKRALVFTIIARALAALRDWLADVVAVNGEARDAIAQLKGALLTLAQPLVQIIIPAFTALVKVLATVVSFIANIVSALFGTTAKESANAAKSLNDQKNAYKGVGGAAKSASKQLASFDEINKLSGEGGGGSGIIQPDFSTAANFAFLDKIADKLKKIGQDIVNLFKDVTGFIGNVFSGDWGAALDNIINFVSHARILLADLLDFVGYIFGAIIDTIIEKCGLAGTPVGDMLTGIKDIVQGALGIISGILTGDLEKMKQSVIQRVPELPGREGFRHRFLTHGNRAHLHIFQFFSQLRQQAGICLALHVAQHHIGVGAIIQLHPLQRQAGISDTAAQQSGVLHQILHKAVVAAPEDAAGVRLLNGASGKLLHIHQNTAVPAIDYQQRLAGKHPQHRLLLFQADGSIAGCDKASEKCVRRFHVRQVGCRQPLCDHPLQNTLLRVAVHHPQSGAAAANGEIAGRHVEAAPRTQRIVQRRRSGGKFLFHALRPPRAFLDSMGKTA